MGRVTGPPLLPKADKVPRTKRFTRRTVVASGHAGEMCNTARRLSRGRRGRVVVSVLSFFVTNDYACVRTRTRSLTLTHTHARTAARGESARRDSNVLGAGSLDAQEARGAPAARAPAWAFSLPCASVRPLSVHRPPIRSPHRPPVPPHAPNGPTQGFAFAAPLRGGGEKGALPLIPPTPAGFPLPLLRSLLKGGSPPGKRPLPPGAVSFPGV